MVADAAFARRVYLDIWGLLPHANSCRRSSPTARPTSATARVDAARRQREVRRALDLVLERPAAQRRRREPTSRRPKAAAASITPWLLPALYRNPPYDQFVAKLLNPTPPGDPEGFLIGVNWRGETSAAVTPWMQASQNTAQVFLGVNLKCNACHDSFVNKWKLKDAYGLAAFFSPEPTAAALPLRHRAGRVRRAGVPLSRVGPPDRRPRRSRTAARRPPRSSPIRATAGCRARSSIGSGSASSATASSRTPTRWTAGPGVPSCSTGWRVTSSTHGYDLKHLIATIVTSRAYQMPPWRGRPSRLRATIFPRPEVRRLTAEQLSDAIGAITGEWSMYTPRTSRVAGERTRSRWAAVRRSVPSDRAAVAAGSSSAGRGAAAAAPAASTSRPARAAPARGAAAHRLRRAVRRLRPRVARAVDAPHARARPAHPRSGHLGSARRRDDAPGARAGQWRDSDTAADVRRAPDARRAAAGAEEPLHEPIAGRTAQRVTFDVDVSSASTLWLLVHETGSNEPERVLPVWAHAEFVAADGNVDPALVADAVDASGLRGAAHGRRGVVRVTNVAPVLRHRRPRVHGSRQH